MLGRVGEERDVLVDIDGLSKILKVNLLLSINNNPNVEERKLVMNERGCDTDGVAS